MQTARFAVAVRREDGDLALARASASIVRHEARSAGVTETLRVEIWEGSAEHPIYGRCILGQGPAQPCAVVATTPLGRRVYSDYPGHPATGLLFAIDRTVIALSVGSHVSTNRGHWSPVALSTGEIETFVDSFVRAGRWDLCWIRHAEGRMPQRSRPARAPAESIRETPE